MLCGDRCGVGTRTSWAIFGAVTLLRGVWSANLSRGHAYPDDEAEGSTSNRCRQRHERRLPLESSRLTITEYSVHSRILFDGGPTGDGLPGIRTMGPLCFAFLISAQDGPLCQGPPGPLQSWPCERHPDAHAVLQAAECFGCSASDGVAEAHVK